MSEQCKRCDGKRYIMFSGDHGERNIREECPECSPSSSIPHNKELDTSRFVLACYGVACIVVILIMKGLWG